MALLATLPAELRQTFGDRLRPAAWYPYAAYAGLLETIDSWPGTDQADALAAFGHWGLQRDAGNVLKILSVFSSVDALVRRGFSSWGGFLWGRHCDTGEVFLAESGERTATMGLRHFPNISPAHCRMTRGYLEAMGQAVGARSLRMLKTQCVHRGDEFCAYRGEWE